MIAVIGGPVVALILSLILTPTVYAMLSREAAKCLCRKDITAEMRRADAESEMRRVECFSLCVFNSATLR